MIELGVAKERGLGGAEGRGLGEADFGITGD